MEGFKGWSSMCAAAEIRAAVLVLRSIATDTTCISDAQRTLLKGLADRAAQVARELEEEAAAAGT